MTAICPPKTQMEVVYISRQKLFLHVFYASTTFKFIQVENTYTTETQSMLYSSEQK